MTTQDTITRAKADNDNPEVLVMHKGGTAEKHIRIQAIVVPDAWHAIMRANEADQEILLEVWHLAHALKDHVQGHLIK